MLYQPTFCPKTKKYKIGKTLCFGLSKQLNFKLEIVITRATPAFHNLFVVMGCVFNINTVHNTVEKLTFQAFY